MEVKDFGRKGAKGMKKKVFSDEKKVEVLREAEQSGKSIQEVCRTHGISEPTFYLWRKRIGFFNGKTELLLDTLEVKQIKDVFDKLLDLDKK